MSTPSLRSVRIRMYRGILGDCFLLRTTMDLDGVTTVRSILIDCGVLQNVAAGSVMLERLSKEVVEGLEGKDLAAVVDGPTRIRQVAQDLLHTVGHRIDLLIVTHEHYDHLSGFGFSSERFMDDGVTIDRLWLAWTEDFSNEQANVLRARFSKGKSALVAASMLAEKMGADAPRALSAAAALAEFSGPPSGSAGFAAAGRPGTRDILQMLKDKAGPRSTEYLEPGNVVDLEAFGLTAYVLGPPRKEHRLRKSDPSDNLDTREVYLTRSDAALAAESTANTRLRLMAATEETADFAGITPFGAMHLQPLRDGRRTSNRSKAARKLEKLYGDPDGEWRKIDEEWSASIEALALKMDSDTNNTSLAIAFELPDGQVLLFPGDAQVGNWLSWNDQTYRKRDRQSSAVESVTAEELLGRTTFYKGGHHLSHNATAKALGLERMTDPRLVAAAPVVEAVAAVQGKGRKTPGMGWQMPFPALYAALLESTRGRIVRGDGKPEEERKAFEDAPTSTDRPVTIAHADDDLWVELTFDLA